MPSARARGDPLAYWLAMPYSPMRPNSAQAAARAKRDRVSRYTTPPSQAEVVARPFLYLLAAAIWAALFLVVVGLYLALPLALGATSEQTMADRWAGMSPNPGAAIWAALFLVVVGLYLALPLALGATSEQTMADRWAGMSPNPGAAIVQLVILAIILVPILGYVLLALPFATLPLAVLAATYAVRSLQSGYRGERLSATGYSNEALGPLRVTPAALSLIPLRVTPWTLFWTRASMIGWVPSRRLFLAALPWGAGYLVTIVWLLWPIAGVGWIVWPIVSALFVAATIVLLVRDVRTRYRADVGAAPSVS
jgi:hypothetical protein